MPLLIPTFAPSPCRVQSDDICIYFFSTETKWGQGSMRTIVNTRDLLRLSTIPSISLSSLTAKVVDRTERVSRLTAEVREGGLISGGGE